ncbi:hypothetical protein T11_9698 [Trichinella zimbabwensis]|uniref:Uncharacterized protein n=1 Tax=Trichinella zimbabwensis TaxID=268475 RepID=A0A0V1HY90_9BILA|nr:hypothetical protein T11_9698 [Trichinella zimbabwensis]
MPNLMKGATPNELVKGVTANSMTINHWQRDRASNDHHWIGAETSVSSLRQLRILIAIHNAKDFTSLSIPSQMDRDRGARGGAGAVELGLTLLVIPLQGPSKAAGLWYRNRTCFHEYLQAIVADSINICT